MIRKLVPFILLCLITSCLFAQKQETAAQIWLKDYEKALEQANEKNRPVLLFFSGSDWSQSCIMLSKEVFETEHFRAYAQRNLVLLKADFPRRKKNRLRRRQRKHNEMLAEKYNQNDIFPLVVILDTEGKVKGETGYLHGGAENFVHHLESLLN